MFVQMPGKMINVGIVGSPSAINRHTKALGKVSGIRVSGQWVLNKDHNSVNDAKTGVALLSPDVIIKSSDALIVADRGCFATRIVTSALKNARHVFLYPNVIESLHEAYQLMHLAREANVVLKCGRTGNTSMQGLLDAISDTSSINMIELQHDTRISSPAKLPRIYPVLLGDMEIISRMVHARLISIKAKGFCMISSKPEIINARLEFDNGCVVSYNSNLVAAQNEFFITLIVRNKVLKYDFIHKKLTGWQLLRTSLQNGNPVFFNSAIGKQQATFEQELFGYISLLRSSPTFLSVSDNGFESFILADRILEKIAESLVQCA
jgi:hypothetical protein